MELSTTGAGHRPENLLVGALLVTAAFFCVSLVTALAKVSGGYTSTGVILLVQNVLCLLCMIPLAARDGLASLRTERLRMHVLRAAMGTACWYAIFFSITLIPLTNAILLAYSAPLWMPLIAWFVTRKPIASATWIGAGIGFAGVVLVLQPQGQSFNIGDVSAIAGALFLAVAMMSVRWLGATEPTNRILFYYFLLSSLMMLPIAVIDWRPIPAAAWPWLLAIGVAQFFSQLLIVIAYRYASAEKVGPFIYSVIVFTAVIDWIVWRHVPGPLVFLGMALVIGGGLVAVRAKAPPQGTAGVPPHPP